VAVRKNKTKKAINIKNQKKRDALIKYLLNLSIALIAALFSFFLQKVFGFPL
jgi:hypothetical protein